MYQDNHYIIVHKPAGILVHRTSIDRGETQFFVQIVRDQFNREVYPCHRLDKATSGLMLFALSKEALRKANELFADGKIHKTYQALTRGWILEGGTIDYPLRVEAVDKSNPSPKNLYQKAITDYEPLQRFEIPQPLGRHSTARFTLCQLNPKTGRRHQLRRHLAHLRHPIIGDTTHGDGLQNKFARTHFKTNRLFLAATQLSFTHPFTNKEITITQPPDDTFLDAIRLLQT